MQSNKLQPEAAMKKIAIMIMILLPLPSFAGWADAVITVKYAATAYKAAEKAEKAQKQLDQAKRMQQYQDKKIEEKTLQYEPVKKTTDFAELKQLKMPENKMKQIVELRNDLVVESYDDPVDQ